MLKRKYIFFLFISTILFTVCNTTLYATEPENIQITKNTLIQYHDSGAYAQDITAIIHQAQTYLSGAVATQQKQHPQEKLAIVFDIDETALSSYDRMRTLNFGGTLDEINRSIAEETNAPVIPATLALYKQALKEHVHVFFITGRYDTPLLRKNTVQNLRAAGFEQYDGLMMKPTDYNQYSVSTYKTAMRKKITDQGYHIVLNIGDQMSDLLGGYADKTYKLPNPYYYIP
jgi:acid phosphatase